MLLTVKEMSKLADVSIKTLHHYHKIGLLLPAQVTEAGYRLYGQKELERLQGILFFRELDFPLKMIHKILDSNLDRISILKQQKKLFLKRIQKLHQLINTIDESIHSTVKGEHMDQSNLFRGFSSEAEWEEALQEQNEHLTQAYQYDLLKENSIQIEEMNEAAIEAQRFTSKMIAALQNKLTANDDQVQAIVKQHLHYLNTHGHQIKPSDYLQQTRFFIEDDFHREMLESQQPGLAYYLHVAAISYAETQQK
ncbi:DNA-binding transcriptional regulator, MerR family [Seinonella peptonophila]|uniref:DNA-binding transcriptional regulator, MerR family n=1 Tax=Seinonella peptonophila TaxID=112248 RepID=A0A1M4UUK9_9BACL|nr:MerR family transcriptional regulator [Seinonella peptonophila]SHE60374.1 DNA-binding transcriptional regulator, MerR family [Seinonella peptonophila]